MACAHTVPFRDDLDSRRIFSSCITLRWFLQYLRLEFFMKSCTRDGDEPSTFHRGFLFVPFSVINLDFPCFPSQKSGSAFRCGTSAVVSEKDTRQQRRHITSQTVGRGEGIRGKAHSRDARGLGSMKRAWSLYPNTMVARHWNPHQTPRSPRVRRNRRTRTQSLRLQRWLVSIQAWSPPHCTGHHPCRLVCVLHDMGGMGIRLQIPGNPSCHEPSRHCSTQRGIQSSQNGHPIPRYIFPPLHPSLDGSKKQQVFPETLLERGKSSAMVDTHPGYLL